MTKYLFISIALFLISFVTYGQAERSNHWYFGYQAGLDFSTPIPTADTSGKLESIEGSACMSDIRGDLLFYTNGETVWNKQHTIMPNGSNIEGWSTCAQSSLIVPFPGDTSKYYLFTTGAGIGPTSNYFLNYSVVDMTLDNGLGDVTAVKNVQLLTNATEQITGTIHCNAIDYWVLTRKQVLNAFHFYAYRVSAAGISAPVISVLPFTNPNGNEVGTLTFAQHGEFLAFSSLLTPIYLFDFNKSTGELSHKYTIPLSTNEMAYSTALSGNGTKLYASIWKTGGNNTVSQYDLQAANIAASRQDLTTVFWVNGSPNGYGFIGQLKLASDQRIYVSRWNEDNPFGVNPNTWYSLDSLDAILFPDSAGTACTFQRNYRYLDHKPTQIGLPNFISNFTLKDPLPADCTMGLEEYTKQHFRFSPNPFSNELTLQSDEELRNTTLTVRNSLGQVIRGPITLSGQSVKMNREDLKAGIYFFKLSKNDTPIHTEKIIITD